MGIFGNIECNVTSPFMSAPICCAGGSGIVLSAGETTVGWSGPFPSIEDVNEHGLAVAYLILLFYLFLGVALAADVFMSAIEHITSKNTTVKVKSADGTARNFRVRTWNPTVANLTLMALGSSAPEILLSIIELVTNEMYSGELGPSTIVGSAAFNLFVIIAVCVVAIPPDESRKIFRPGVYWITAGASLWAYTWLIIILIDDVIDIWEALLTFLFFPLVVWFAFYADKWTDKAWRSKHWLFKRCAQPEKGHTQTLPSSFLVDVKNPDGSPLTPDELLAMVKRLQRSHEGLNDMSDDKAVALITAEMYDRQPKSRAHYRRAATQNLARGTISDQPPKKPLGQGARHRNSRKVAVVAPEMDDPYAKALIPTVQFASETYAVVEAGGSVTVQVKRMGDLSGTIKCKYTTEDGVGSDAARAADGDFLATAGELVFEPGIESQEVSVKIIDDNEAEPDEHFFIALTSVEGEGAALGPISRTQVTIINDDFPGTLVLVNEDIRVKESDKEVVIEVNRVQGCAGAVSLQYRCLDHSAVSGKNYTAVSGVLEWPPNDVTTKSITVPITDDDRAQGTQFFEVEIHEATGGATFDEKTDGNKDRSIARITIEDDDKVTSIAERAIQMLGSNEQDFAIGSARWKDQFLSAIRVSGDDDDDADPPEKPSIVAWAFHLISLPWKVVVALVPPATIGGGWPCFTLAILLIGILTAVIGDLANLLGCALGLKNTVVAITLVALGTSLPDTFASRAAARCDNTADAAVGNVTGSNAVNVFLGLGVSWTIGSCYWAANGVTPKMLAMYPEVSALKGKAIGDSIGLIVPAGQLYVTVAIFVSCAVFAIAVLQVRRVYVGAELGLKYRWPTAILLVSLWLLYVSLATAMAYGGI